MHGERSSKRSGAHEAPTRQGTTLVVAGASGFIGRVLPGALSEGMELIGLSRDPERARRGEGGEGYLWRRCDLFSRKQTLEALRGADQAVYLVHSLIPSAHLTQGAPADMDVICADNFARGAASHGVGHIVYVTGKVAADHQGSSQNIGDREVRRSLARYGAQVTTLRTPMVMGAGGAAFRLLLSLVRRLRAVALPRWAAAKFYPIDRSDMVRLIAAVISDEGLRGGGFEVGGDTATSVLDLAERISELLGMQRGFYLVKGEWVGLSTRVWSSLSGVPVPVVRQFVDTLRTEAMSRAPRLVDRLGYEPMSLDDSLRRSLGISEFASGGRQSMDGDELHEGTEVIRFEDDKRKVRSVQRLPVPPGQTAQGLADEYARWLPRFMSPFIRVERDELKNLRFYLRPLSKPALILEYDRRISHGDRHLFWIRGGALARQSERGRLEFRQVLDGTVALAAIHEFEPRLPWPLYRATQAKIHAFVMARFAAHLEELQKGEHQ